MPPCSQGPDPRGRRRHTGPMAGPWRKGDRWWSRVLAVTLLAALTTGSSPAVAGAHVHRHAHAHRHAHDGTALVGTFRLAPGVCQGYGVAGSYIRLAFPGATPTHQRFFASVDSTCPNETFTLLAPAAPVAPVALAAPGGLVTGTYQGATQPAIAAPVAWAGLTLSIGTEKIDPQSQRRAPAPAITDDKGVLAGQLAAWTVDWGALSLNQGVPEPGQRRPDATGTYTPATRAFVLTWSCPVRAGRFTGFTVDWHLAGTFTPAHS
jgi:hypothetical protein